MAGSYTEKRAGVHDGWACPEVGRSLLSVFPFHTDLQHLFPSLLSKSDHLSKFYILFAFSSSDSFKKIKKKILFILKVFRDQKCTLPPAHVMPELTAADFATLDKLSNLFVSAE